MKEHNNYETLELKLKRVDNDTLWNQGEQKQLFARIERKLDKGTQKEKVWNVILYTSSIAAFLVCLFIGYQIFQPEKNVATPPEPAPTTEQPPKPVEEEKVVEEIIGESAYDYFEYRSETHQEKIIQLTEALSTTDIDLISTIDTEAEPITISIKYSDGQVDRFNVWTEFLHIEEHIEFRGVFKKEGGTVPYVLDSSIAEMLFIENIPYQLPNFRTAFINDVTEAEGKLRLELSYTNKIDDGSGPNGYQLEHVEDSERVVSENASIFLLDYSSGEMNLYKATYEDLLAKANDHAFVQLYEADGEILLLFQNYLP